jgi:hypothetical protein
MNLSGMLSIASNFMMSCRLFRRTILMTIGPITGSKRTQRPNRATGQEMGSSCLDNRGNNCANGLGESAPENHVMHAEVTADGIRIFDSETYRRRL